MYCPRLDHFMRLNADGTISRCGHMVSPPKFNTLYEMESSDWLSNVKRQFRENQWPAECIRCKQTESINDTSIRLHSISLDDSEEKRDYLQIGGVLDNICNSACQMCSENYSTKIGRLKSKASYPKISNIESFWKIPQDRILHLDINGGEPTISKNYKHLLNNLPPNLKTLRVNTNGAVMLPILNDIRSRGIEVTLTVSFDGIGLVHDYVRWPIKWDKFKNNLLKYKTYGLSNLNLWTTVNTLNINDLPNILKFAKDYEIDHSYGILSEPKPLNIRYSNFLTRRAKSFFELSNDQHLKKISKHISISSDNQSEFNEFVKKQDELRGIKIEDYIETPY